LRWRGAKSVPKMLGCGFETRDGGGAKSVPGMLGCGFEN